MRLVAEPNRKKGTEMNDDTRTETEVEVDLATLVRDIAIDFLKDNLEDVSPYQVHVVVNRTLKALGNDDEVRPQMMYNYDRNGLIVKGRKGSKSFTLDEVVDFVTRFITRRTAK